MKTTLHGVKSNSTKVMFRKLKAKGFRCSLEKGPVNTFKISTKINGVDFLVSCVDGSEPIYTKKYSRSMFNWIKFKSLNDLVIASMLKKDSAPTKKQKDLFLRLTKEIAQYYGDKLKLKITIPWTVEQMSLAIMEALNAKYLLSNGQVGIDNKSIYVHLSERCGDKSQDANS